MEPLSTMSGTKWNFWMFECDHGKVYRRIKVASVETFEDLKRLIEGKVNFAVDKFALFRDGVEPHYEDSSNKYAFTWVNTQNDEAYFEYFYKFWEKRIFCFKFLNGIYCNPFKISCWTTDECDEDAFRLKLKKLHYTTNIFYLFSMDYHIRLTRMWTLAVFENHEFTIPIRQRFVPNVNPVLYESELLEKLIKIISRRFHFTEDIHGLIMTPSNLSIEKWRIPHFDNRFIYCSIKASMEEANKIFIRFASSLAYIIYPRVPLIFLAFCYFTNGILQLGIYQSGLPSLRNEIPHDRQFESANDMAFIVAHKIKQIVASCVSLNSEIRVSTSNAIPSEGTDFTDRIYEYSVNGRHIYSYI